MYSTYNEGKSVVAEWFIRTLKNKIYKHMTAVSKNLYFDVLHDIVDNYNKWNYSRPPHLKVKEPDISLTKNYCITINIKIISFFHIFTLKIQILGSHELSN